MEYEIMKPIRLLLKISEHVSRSCCLGWRAAEAVGSAEFWSSSKRSAHSLMSVERKSSLKRATVKTMPTTRPTANWTQRKNEKVLTRPRLRMIAPMLLIDYGFSMEDEQGEAGLNAHPRTPMRAKTVQTTPAMMSPVLKPPWIVNPSSGPGRAKSAPIKNLTRLCVGK